VRLEQLLELRLELLLHLLGPLAHRDLATFVGCFEGGPPTVDAQH
jgi:hypothetical protein